MPQNMHSFALLLLSAALARAQSLIESSSFGYGDKVSPNGYEIPNWHVSGEGHVPEILSDKVVLTPSYPGNTRGALWSQSKVSQSDWTAELAFRASGPDRGSGNLQLWYAKDGQTNVGTASLFTAGKFDGLALVVDQYGGKGGSIRGFMNDGNLDFKSHHAVDSLAFGHCEYAFRNRGRPVKLQVRQKPDNFEVIIDNRLCFASDKIRLPSDYTFGLTAASAETPDSFEVYRFKLEASDAQSAQEPPLGQQRRPGTSAMRRESSEASDAQIQELKDKLQSISQAVAKLEHDIFDFYKDGEAKHRELMRMLPTRENLNTINTQSDKLDRLERTLASFQSQFSNLHSAMRDSHDSLTEGIPKHIGNLITSNAPRMGVLIFVFVIIQIILYGVYTLYKRRSKQGPKKYL